MTHNRMNTDELRVEQDLRVLFCYATSIAMMNSTAAPLVYSGCGVGGHVDIIKKKNLVRSLLLLLLLPLLPLLPLLLLPLEVNPLASRCPVG